MEKKPNQTIKDYILGGMEKDMGYSRDLLEKVISFQGESMLEAAKTFKEIEISGLGILYVAKGKLSRELARAEKILAVCQNKLALSTTEADILKNERKVGDMMEKVAFLKSKK